VQFEGRNRRTIALIQNRPEHRLGWREAIDVDGEHVEIEAIHHRRQRMPRGSEMAQQMARRGQWSMVEEITCEWAVLHRRRRVCELRQAPSGMFQVSALRSFPHMDIREAAAAAFRFLRPGVRKAAASSAPADAPAAGSVPR
jgi:hypothetical protein